MCWWEVAFVPRKNYGFASRFEHAFTRLIEIAWSAPHHKRSQQKDKDGTRQCGRLHDHSWLRSGAEIATFPRRPPNQTTLPRAGRLSRLFPQNVMRHADQTFDGRHSATSIGLGESQTSTAPFGVPPSPAPTGRILPCLLPEPSLDQTSDNAGSVRSKRRKRAAAMVKSFDADLKGRRKAEFEEPKQSGGQPVPKRHSINKSIPQALQSEQPRRRKALISELPPSAGNADCPKHVGEAEPQ